MASDELVGQVTNWTPVWTVDVGQGCECGIAMDDGCYLVLFPKEDGSWVAGKWIPPAVAIKLGELARRQVTE